MAENPTKRFGLTRRDISDSTGFDKGELFDDADDVRRYFTIESQRQMFGGEAIENPALLERMAGMVIENRWHMKGESETPTKEPTYFCPECGYRVTGKFVTTPFHETNNHAKVVMVQEVDKIVVQCPECGKAVWDIATQDQRLNKCWECGTRFDNILSMDNDNKDPGEIWDELEYDDRAKIVDKFSGEWDDGSNVDNAFWEELSEHDKEIIIIYFDFKD